MKRRSLRQEGKKGGRSRHMGLPIESCEGSRLPSRNGVSSLLKLHQAPFWRGKGVGVATKRALRSMSRRFQSRVRTAEVSDDWAGHPMQPSAMGFFVLLEEHQIRPGQRLLQPKIMPIFLPNRLDKARSVALALSNIKCHLLEIVEFCGTISD